MSTVDQSKIETDSKSPFKSQLCEKIGHFFVNNELLDSALTHKSFHNENSEKSAPHNERLEFLGDAVLDLILSDYLMSRFPDLDEGELSKIRASLVNEVALSEVAIELGLPDVLLLGKGEKMAGGSAKPRLLSSTLEALIGAVYKDAGFATAQEVTQNIFAKKIESLDLTIHFKDDYKTHLQEKSQGLLKLIPVYEVISEEGPDHEKTFTVTIQLQNKVLATGEGRTKKQAEQAAAKAALESFDQLLETKSKKIKPQIKLEKV